jgi:hypothetical protein
MYFLRRLRPLEVAGERVRSLRVSLNAPVLSTPDLPAGPSRAVIVVHRDARGRMDATVGVRSVVSGEVAYWSFDGDLLSQADLSVAADAALTFAESLGFLFDEAPLAGGAVADKSFRGWLAGEDASAGALREAQALDGDDETDALFSDDPPELALEDLAGDSVAEPASEPPRRAPPPPRPVAAPSASDPSKRPVAVPPSLASSVPPPAPQRTLSKFRSRGAASPSEADAAARNAPLRQPLARVQLVKRRSPEDERKLVIRRLLTSF